MQSPKYFFYKYQRSRSFIDLCPGCLRSSIFIFLSSKTAGLIETKLHVDEGMKVCSFDLGHMIKMATMPINSKNIWKLLRNWMTNDLELGMHHWVLGLYQVCSTGDPWLNLTYFTARSNLVTYAFIKLDLCYAVVAFDILSWCCV